MGSEDLILLFRSSYLFFVVMLFVVHHRTEWVLICKVTTFSDKYRTEVRENNHRIIESSDHRNLDGMFWGCFARNLGGNLLKEWPEARNQSSDLRRNLYGVFIHGAHSKQSSEFRRMFFWILRKI